MSIALTCPTCQAAFKVKPEYAGKRGQCPRCKTALQVPLTGEPRPAAPAERSKAPTLPASRECERPEAAALMRRVLDAFDGDIPPGRTTVGYRVGILFVTAAMLLLPVLYLLLIAGVGYALTWHATANVGILKGLGGHGARLLLYVGPLLAGGILLLFMVKPLFARPPQAGRGRALEIGTEPVLFAFVTRIARAVHAPEPRRIEIDCDVNASAGFGRGLAGLFGRDLVLTIGLPLVAGLTARQFAGVLAHELGHFAQGTGMRLSYLVRSINGWFHRVVYERDAWDEALVAWCDQDIRIAVIFYLARFCVWVTRGILFVFMLVGHGLSCFLLRQMEYDADRYAARLVGGDTFAEMSSRLPVLGAGLWPAQALVTECWRKDRYPDDLPGVIVHLAEDMPPKVRRQIDKEFARAKTGLFDTHPAHRDRVANVRREKTDGIFALDGPATRLFADYPRLARDVSLDLYRNVFGKRIKRTDLVPVEAIFAGPGGG